MCWAFASIGIDECGQLGGLRLKTYLEFPGNGTRGLAEFVDLHQVLADAAVSLPACEVLYVSIVAKAPQGLQD